MSCIKLCAGLRAITRNARHLNFSLGNETRHLNLHIMSIEKLQKFTQKRIMKI